MVPGEGVDVGTVGGRSDRSKLADLRSAGQYRTSPSRRIAPYGIYMHIRVMFNAKRKNAYEKSHASTGYGVAHA